MTVNLQSLGLRLSWWLAAQTLLGLVLVSCVVYFVTWQNLQRQRAELMADKRALVQHIVREADESGDLAQFKHKLDDFLSSHRDMKVRLNDGAGRVLFGEPSGVGAGHLHSTQATRAADANPASGLPWGTSREAREPDIEDISSITTSATIKGPVSVTLLLDPSADNRFLRELGWALLVASCLGSALISAGGFLLVRSGLSPVRKLAAQADALDASTLGYRLSGAGQPLELQPLVERFNSLLDRLERAYVQLEAFNADVAHELFTPLASMKTATELVLRKPRPAEKLQDVLHSNLEDLQQLTSIVGDMLFLSRADRGAKARGVAVVSLVAVVREVADYFEATVAEAGLTIEVLGNASGTWDVGLLKRALSNLVANATRHADPHSSIQLEVSEAEGFVSLSVVNCGQAVRPEYTDRIFDRFFRADTARGDARHHHGLGLSIVAAIARMHGGTTFVKCHDGKTRIGLSIPKYSN